MGFLNDSSRPKTEYVNDLLSLGLKALRFNVSLGYKKDGISLSKVDILKICNTIIRRLCVLSDDVFLYGQKNSICFERFRVNCEKESKRYRVKLDSDLVTGYEDFWGAYWNQRGTVLFSAKIDINDYSDLISMTQDPGFLSNLGAVAHAPAIDQARKIIKQDETRLCFLLSSAWGLNDLYIFGSESRIRECIFNAYDKCYFSDRFLNLYGMKSR